jgi:hypothetical protein
MGIKEGHRNAVKPWELELGNNRTAEDSATGVTNHQDQRQSWRMTGRI